MTLNAHKNTFIRSIMLMPKRRLTLSNIHLHNLHWMAVSEQMTSACIEQPSSI